MEGKQHLCSLRKENLTSWNVSETESARRVFTLEGSEENGSWHPVTELPFGADKWCFTTVVLYNYLYIIGGYRQHVKRGWEFKMASFRFNPFTGTWVGTAPLLKVGHCPRGRTVQSDPQISPILDHFLFSIDDTSVQWPVRVASTPWEAGTWTRSSPPTPARPSIQPWNAMTLGTTRGGLCSPL